MDAAAYVIRKWNSRKFAIAMFLVALSSVALYLKLLEGAQWIEFNKWICFAYMMGNVGSAAVTATGGISVTASKE